MYTQLVLDLQLRESHTFGNFLAADNELPLALLQLAAKGQGEQQLFIWGEQFIGKSHLLQAVCQAASDEGLAISYLPLQQVIDYSPEILDGLEMVDLVCVDDVQLVANKADWQVKLFDLINRMREHNKQLLFAGDLPPNELNLQLEDLRSRLNWGPVLLLQSLNDQQKQQALQLRAMSRGIELPDPVAAFMLKNYARDLAGLYEKLETLDKASLEQQRRVTIPFVKAVFEE